jgi:hypothetical protein
VAKKRGEKLILCLRLKCAGAVYFGTPENRERKRRTRSKDGEDRERKRRTKLKTGKYGIK